MVSGAFASAKTGLALGSLLFSFQNPFVFFLLS